MYVSSRRLAIRGRPRRRTGRARKTLWSTTDTGNLTAATGVSITPQDLCADLNDSGVGYIGGTIARVHISLACNEPAADNSQGVTWGLHVWDKNNVAPTVPAVQTDFNTPWMYIHNLSLANAWNPFIGTVNSVSTVFWGDRVDVRVKRRLPQQDDSLFFFLHNFGTGTVSFRVFARVLITLP